MNRFNRLNKSRVVVLVAVCIAAAMAHTASGQTGNSVSGQAIGIAATTPSGSLIPTPLATLAAGGGMSNTEIAAVSVPGVLTAQDVAATTTGVVGENASSAQSLVSASNVNVLNGIVSARQLIVLASSASNGQQATSKGSSTIVDLVVNGVPMGVVSPAPNTTIDVPTVGTVVLNEQVTTGGGITDRGMNVTMIHVILKNSLTGATTGDIVVGRASSYAKFVR